MAKEKYTVIFNQRGAGGGTAGYVFKNQAEAQSAGLPQVTAKIAVVEAGSSQEAATAVRRAFGDGQITGKIEVTKTSNIEEKVA